LAKSGYTFGGWNTLANGTGDTYAAGGTFSMGSANVTLYALWTEEVATYTVTYDGNTNTGGTIPTDSGTYEASSTVTVLGNTGSLVKTGYTFDGWNTLANGSGTDYAADATFSMGSTNVTLYAKWTAVYAVTYDGNTNTGGTVPTDSNTYVDGATVTVLDNTGSLVKTGFTFDGWNTAADGSGTDFAAAATFAIDSYDVTLYAQWVGIPTYRVIYIGNTNTGGSEPTDVNTYETGDTVTVLSYGSLTKTDNIFDGWNTVADGSGTDYADGATFTIGSSEVTLYAQWVEGFACCSENNDPIGWDWMIGMGDPTAASDGAGCSMLTGWMGYGTYYKYVYSGYTYYTPMNTMWISLMKMGQDGCIWSGNFTSGQTQSIWIMNGNDYSNCRQRSVTAPTIELTPVVCP
jgi:uncharacterized repeat protein (TIGR02543 family)